MTTTDRIPLRTARLADTFASMLRDHLSPEQWEEMREKNATARYADPVCASHDYCDANDVMAAACRRVRVSLTTEAGRAAWNAAWPLAKRHYLTAPRYVVRDNLLGTATAPTSRAEAGRLASLATVEAARRGERVATASGLDRFTVAGA